MEADVIKELKKLTGKKNVMITKRCNWSIFQALKFAKNLGKTKVFIQDEGGWLTYKEYPKKIGLEQIELKTLYGKINTKKLAEHLDSKSILLVNSLSGYFANQPMSEIQIICKEKKTILINDISGSIGTDDAKIGDIIVSSFGEAKPVNLGFGGLIASDIDELIPFIEAVNDYKMKEDEFVNLQNILKYLPIRLKMYSDAAKKIKFDLQKHQVLYKHDNGINVVVKYNDDKEKNEVIDYCKANSYEFTECPRYIRTNSKAISIEVKRL